MNQYYETVEVSSAGLPPIDKADPQWEELEWSEEVFVIDKKGNKNSAFYSYREKVWYSNGKMTDAPTHYLRPVSLSDLIREVAGKCVDFGFRQHAKYGYISPTEEQEFINSLTKTASNER